MSYHGHRRGNRIIALATAHTPWNTFWDNFRNRQVWFRLVLCVLALIGTLFAVGAGRPPFRYRLGQHPEQGIAARVDFQLLNLVTTERARDQAAAEVLRIFRHDPAQIEALPQLLVEQLQQLLAIPLDKPLPAPLARGFGLTEGVLAPSATPPDVSPKSLLRQNLVSIASQPEQLKELEKQFREFIEPIRWSGVLLNLSVPGMNDTEASTLRVVTTQNTEDICLISQVHLPQVLAANGSLGRAWKDYPQLLKVQSALETWLQANTPETLSYDDPATQLARTQARERVKDHHDSFKVGNLLVSPGEFIDAHHLELLQAEYETHESRTPLWQRWTRMLAVGLIVLFLGILNGVYLIQQEPVLVRSATRLSIYLSVLILTLGLGRVLSYDPWRAELIPLICTSMILAVAYNPYVATLAALTLSLLLSFATGSGLGSFVVLMSAASVAVLPLSQVSSRTTLIEVGLLSAVTYLLTALGVALLESQSVADPFRDGQLWWDCLRGAAWCLIAGFIVAGSLPFIESIFGVVTDISLLELGDVSHPLLAELVRRAPGTYNHSITMASIAEQAADAIGANGLLVKVGAYFHDIGKMLKPQYFVENMTLGEASRHEHLAPAMSTLIIIGHVKDGADLAEQAGLPRPLIDFIEQHHGTTLVEYFYRAATKQADQNPELRTEVLESSFRYPGPKPQTREAAVMMLADAVESASRTLSEPTAKRLERLVADLAMKRLLDGQFEECGLTLTELHIVQESLVKSLIGIYHGRIKYPEQRSA